MKLNGKIAYVTGGAMGNGLGVVKMFLKYGATVIIADNNERVFQVADLLTEKGFNVRGHLVDIRERNQIKESVKDVITEFGRIDILVNNAGVCKLKPFLEMTDEDRDFHFNVNLCGTWNVTQEVLPYMIKNEYGKIINLSSVTGVQVADPGESAYAATKGAILGFTKALAVEYADKHINVNAILPGYVKTPMVQNMAELTNPENPEEVLNGIAQNIPMGRLGKINEIGELAAFLASEESSYITGEGIVISGGSTLPETMTMGR